MIGPTVELETKDRIGVHLLPLEGFLPRKFKVCADIEIPEQKAIEDLTDDDRIEVGEKVTKVISDICPKLGPILMTVDGVRKGFVNIGVYTDNPVDINILRDAERVYPHFAYDVSDPENPKQLEEKEWLKG